MNHLFETNDFSNIQVEEFEGSKIYTMDNFYKYPEHILEFLLVHSTPNLWKADVQPSYNGIHFLDQRHDFSVPGFTEVSINLSKICGQLVSQPNRIVTNCTKFLNQEFNDYKNNYWAPHYDYGYTALIYFNGFDCPGTNIYKQLEEDDRDSFPEHYAPWRSKEKFKIMKTVEARFNRMVMFDGSYFLHGMNISDDRFFKLQRINQAIFFN